MSRKEIDLLGNIRYFNEENILHRIDGPAIERFDEDNDYYLMGKRYSYEEWLAIKDFPLLW